MLTTIIGSLIILSVLILTHELGHFLAAKKAGIKVEEFGLGYPPRVWAKKIKGTVYSLNLLPFGGFVKLYGEQLGEKVKNPKQAFWAKSKKARSVVIVAGVVANFLLAVVAFSVVYSKMGIPTETDRVVVIGVMPDSPAAQSGLKPEDVIFKVDREPISDLNAFVEKVDRKEGEAVDLSIARGEKEFVSTLTPRVKPPEGEGPLGVIISNVEMVFYPVWQMPFRGALEGFKEAFGWTKLIVAGIGKMLADLITQGKVPKDVAGPVGIFQLAGGAAKGGPVATLNFLGILSLNLAVLNILPFPALDGGRLMFIFYEVVARKKPKPELERWINAAGMTILLFLIALVTINDLNRLWDTTEFANRLRSLWPF